MGDHNKGKSGTALRLEDMMNTKDKPAPAKGGRRNTVGSVTLFLCNNIASFLCYSFLQSQASATQKHPVG